MISLLDPTTSPQLPDPDELREELKALEVELSIRRCESLRHFVESAWPLLEPEKPFIANWHIDEICRVLELVTADVHKRVIINVPPGTMKTLLVSVMWPAWEWRKRPDLRYLTASYGKTLTIRDNMRLKTLIMSEWYQERWPLELKEDQNSKGRFHTSQDGWRIATSVEGPGTGEHPDRIIIDDPHSAGQARSKTERENATTWFDNTVSMRGKSRDAAIVIIMQRLHEDDLTGHLLERGGWEHICFPMRWEAERRDELGDVTYTPDERDPRTEPGELMWPSLFPEESVRSLELNLGPYGSAGQLQQRPAPEGGGLFKREWFRVVDRAPRALRSVRGWDTAATEGGGDYTVGVLLVEGIDEKFYIVDVVREQLSPAGVDGVMLSTANIDGPEVAQREEKEGGSSGKAVIASHLKLLRKHDYAGVSISGDKVTRAKPFRAQCEGGNVVLVRGDWNKAYLDELSTFPVGKKDDQVDASSCAYNQLLLEERDNGGVLW